MMKFGRVSPDDIEDMLKRDSPNYQDAWNSINKVLRENPTDHRALFLKAKIFSLMKRKEFQSANDQKKKIIRDEAIKYADAIVGQRNSAVCFRMKADALQELDPNDPEILEIRRDAYQKALDLDRNIPQAKIIDKMIDEIEQTLTGGQPLKRPPVASFKSSLRQGKVPWVVHFQDNSLHAHTGSTWYWNFGDGSTAQEQNPSHTYSAAGSYTVSLTVTNNYGSDTKTETGYITIVTGDGTGEVKKKTIISDPIDPSGIYRKYLIDLLSDNPEIIDLCKDEQNLQLKGYLYDVFEGETPKELHILLNCIDELIPLTICRHYDDSSLMRSRIDVRERALTNRGYSEEFVKWGTESWMNALSPHLQNRTPVPEGGEGDLEFTF